MGQISRSLEKASCRTELGREGRFITKPMVEHKRLKGRTKPVTDQVERFRVGLRSTDALVGKYYNSIYLSMRNSQ